MLFRSQYKKLADKYGDKVNNYEFKYQNGKFYISDLDYNALTDDEDLNEDGEGTQTTDIAPKVDQKDDVTPAKPKKKHYDILLSDINESLNILNRGFLKNSEGQYQRGNYILVKEGEQYLAVHKNKLNGGKV